MQNPVANAALNGRDVAPLVLKIAHLMEGQPRPNCIAAFLTLALLFQKPEMSEDELGAAVLEVSQFMCLVLGEGEVQ